MPYKPHPPGAGQARNPWGEKRQRTMSLTSEVWDLLGELAAHPGIGNRSEAMEVAIRWFTYKADNPTVIQKALLKQQRNLDSK